MELNKKTSYPYNHEANLSRKIPRQLSKFHWRVSIAVRTEWLGKGKEGDAKHENIQKVLKWKVSPPPAHS